MSEYMIIKKKESAVGRIIHISGDVDLEMADKVIKQLSAMVTKDAESPIRIMLSSYGGDVYAGLSIYDYIKAMPCPIIMVASGPIMSMGSIILLAGDYRISLENTQFMVHQVSSFAIGSLQDIDKDLTEGKRIMNIMVDIYAKETKYTKKQILAILKTNENFYFPASVALKMGFIHEIKKTLDFK